VSVIWRCVEDLRRREAVVMRTKDGVTNPGVFVVVVEAVFEAPMCLCTGSWGVRKDSSGPGYCANRTRKFVAAGPMGKSSQTMDGNAEVPTRAQRAEAQERDTIAAARNPELHESTAATDGPPLVFATLSHRPTSVVIRAVTAVLQARRVLRWRATIGDCYADAMGLQRRAMEWPLQLSVVSGGSRPLLA
jgi:hypothetical protein